MSSTSVLIVTDFRGERFNGTRVDSSRFLFREEGMTSSKSCRVSDSSTATRETLLCANLERDDRVERWAIGVDALTMLAVSLDNFEVRISERGDERPVGTVEQGGGSRCWLSVLDPPRPPRFLRPLD